MTIQEIKARNEEREKLEKALEQWSYSALSVAQCLPAGHTLKDQEGAMPFGSGLTTYEFASFIAHCYNHPPSADVSFVLAENERLQEQLDRANADIARLQQTQPQGANHDG